MTNYWENFEKLIQEHGQLTRLKIESGTKYNDLVSKFQKKEIQLDDDLRSNLNRLILINETMTSKSEYCFLQILKSATQYLKANNLNFQQLENQYRERKLDIYIIAKPNAENSSKGLPAKFNQKLCPFESHFVVTTDKNYYNDELKQCGYTSYQLNYDRLKETGILTID